MENWFTRRNLSVLGVVMAVAGIGTYWYQHQVEEKEQAGKAVLFKAQQAFETELQALPESDRSVGVALDVDSKFSKTITELKTLLGRTDAARRVRYEASMRLGSLYLDYRHPDQAIEFFKSGAAAAHSSFQKATAEFLLGTAQEQGRLFKESLESFQRGIAENVDTLKADFLLGMVRVSLELKDTAQAKAFSDRLNRELPKSKANEIAKTLLKDTP